MSISLSETLISPTEATRHIPGRPHVSSIWRWFKVGSRGVRLESVVCAGRRFTSLEAIERFIQATTAAADGEPRPVRTARQQQLAIKEAEKKLVLDAKGYRSLASQSQQSSIKPQKTAMATGVHQACPPPPADTHKEHSK